MELLLKAFEKDLADLKLSEPAPKSPAAFYFLRAVGRLVEESRHNSSAVGASGFSDVANLQAAGFPGELLDWTI